VLSGLLAGTLMALVAMIHSAVVGLGLWLPMKLVAGVYLGVNTLLGDGGVVLIGVLTHLLIASGWGVVFAVITRGRIEAAVAVILGAVYGAAVWVAMSYLVLPWANRVMLERVNLAMGWFFVYHLLFGLALATSPAIARWLDRWGANVNPARPPAPA
jgi:hypothetical protein